VVIGFVSEGDKKRGDTDGVSISSFIDEKSPSLFLVFGMGCPKGHKNKEKVVAGYGFLRKNKLLKKGEWFFSEKGYHKKTPSGKFYLLTKKKNKEITG